MLHGGVCAGVGRRQGPADFPIAPVTGDDSPLTEADVTHLMALESVHDMYLELGTPEE